MGVSQHFRSRQSAHIEPQESESAWMITVVSEMPEGVCLLVQGVLNV